MRKASSLMTHMFRDRVNAAFNMLPIERSHRCSHLWLDVPAGPVATQATFTGSGKNKADESSSVGR
jgi:hypothetical protein